MPLLYDSDDTSDITTRDGYRIRLVGLLVRPRQVLAHIAELATVGGLIYFFAHCRFGTGLRVNDIDSISDLRDAWVHSFQAFCFSLSKSFGSLYRFSLQLRLW